MHGPGEHRAVDPAAAVAARSACASAGSAGLPTAHSDVTAAALASASSTGSVVPETSRTPGFAAELGASSACSATRSNSDGTRSAATSTPRVSAGSPSGRGGVPDGAQATPEGSPTHSTAACRSGGGTASATPSSGSPVPDSPTATQTTALTMLPPSSAR
ncbi:hypothetical protein ACFQV2_03695 [Actinokineospora soli]|uniref:Uncharacterized protein n=1 Tax=Actinokineospora soli TaxID=1048753 RepID=A0ABW2TGU9_9PSEU